MQVSLFSGIIYFMIHFEFDAGAPPSAAVACRAHSCNGAAIS